MDVDIIILRDAVIYPVVEAIDILSPARRCEVVTQVVRIVRILIPVGQRKKLCDEFLRLWIDQGRAIGTRCQPQIVVRNNCSDTVSVSVNGG